MRQYILNLGRLTWSQKRHKPRENVHSKIWQSDTSKFFLDRGEFTVYIFSISGEQATSNCRFSYISSWQQTKVAVGKSVSRKLVELDSFPKYRNKPHMVEAFGGWNICPVGRLRQKKRTIWPQTFLKNRSGEKSEQTSLALSCLRWAYSLAGLWVLFFLIPRLMSCASNKAELEHMDEWLLKMICRFRYSVK